MRILFGANYHPSQKAEFVRLALERLGHETIPFTASPGAPEGFLRTAPDVDIVDLVKGLGERPDAFLMVESRDGSPFLPRRIADLDIPTAAWFFDNHLNYRWNKEAAALFDHCFFAQLDQARWAWRYGRDNVVWLPFAADEVFHRDFGVERDIDVGYVGSVTGQKRRYFDALEESGLRVVTNDEYLAYEEVGKFYSRCKLVFNISARRDLNPRAFEASYAGALVVSQSMMDAGAREIFTEGENMAFHNFSDAADILRSLLEDGGRRERMAGNAKNLVRSAHLYRHRAERIVETLSTGVTKGRMRRGSTFVMPVAEGLTLRHKQFGWKREGAVKIAEALRRSPWGALLYLLKYAWSRVREKAWKTAISFGKAPF
ncbi:MAG: glycosyltransferase family protein [Candidatus Nitrospinota bacterium M3_3B_026]